MRRLMLAGVVAAMAACGGSSNTSNTQDVQSFDTTGQDISAKVATYRAQAATILDMAACTAAENDFDGQVRPMVERMKQMSGAMDDRMRSMNGSDDADMGCGSDAMQAELDRHRAVACASSDMATNRAEASQHADMMDELVTHQRGRAAELASMMGMGGNGSMMGGHMTDGGWIMNGGGVVVMCSRAADGGYLMDAGPMPDAGMMDGGH
jgi:hypothetical protein